MQQRFTDIVNRCGEVVADANRLFGTQLSPQINFDLRGRVAGMASWYRLNTPGGFVLTKQIVKFNREMIMGSGFLHILQHTVPHEVAHLVCAARPELGRNHNPGWRRVCMALGGNGQRCHSEEVAYAHGTYVYIATCGTRVTLSKTIHSRIQAGQNRYLRKTRGQLNKFCAWAPLGQEPRQRLVANAQQPAIMAA
jgi:predicted SprT family Zn-dependent metalloprotease